MDRLYMIFSVLIFNFGVQCLLSSAEKDSNGIFPCRCKPEPELENGSKEACDRDTGNCTSGECLDGYHLRDIGHNVGICQPGTRLSNFEKVGIITLKQLQADTNLSSQGDTIDVRFEHAVEFFPDFSLIDPPKEYQNTMVEVITYYKQEAPVYCACPLHDWLLQCNTSSAIHAKNMTISARGCPALVSNMLNHFQFDNMLKFYIPIECSRCWENDTNADPCGNGLFCVKCAIGWMGPDCREPCDSNHHGVNCKDVYNANNYRINWNGTAVAYLSNRTVDVIYHTEVSPQKSEFPISIEVTYRYTDTNEEITYIRRYGLNSFGILHISGLDVSRDIAMRVRIVTHLPNDTAIGSPSSEFPVEKSMCPLTPEERCNQTKDTSNVPDDNTMQGDSNTEDASFWDSRVNITILVLFGISLPICALVIFIFRDNIGKFVVSARKKCFDNWFYRGSYRLPKDKTKDPVGTGNACSGSSLLAQDNDQEPADPVNARSGPENDEQDRENGDSMSTPDTTWIDKYDNDGSNAEHCTLYIGQSESTSTMDIVESAILKDTEMARFLKSPKDVSLSETRPIEGTDGGD